VCLEGLWKTVCVCGEGVDNCVVVEVCTIACVCGGSVENCLCVWWGCGKLFVWWGCGKLFVCVVKVWKLFVSVGEVWKIVCVYGGCVENCLCCEKCMYLFVCVCVVHGM
jgi:hypothetical protein